MSSKAPNPEPAKQKQSTPQSRLAAFQQGHGKAKLASSGEPKGFSADDWGR
jgi:hypothetical protein